MQVEIKRLGPEDAALLDRVAAEVFDAPVDPDRLAAYLAEPGHLMLVAVAGDEIIGQCAAVIHQHPDKVTELYIDEVGVAPGWQRQGIARRMLDAMFALGQVARLRGGLGRHRDGQRTGARPVRVPRRDDRRAVRDVCVRPVGSR